MAHATIDGTGGATYRFELEWQLAAVPGLTDYDHVHTGSIAAVLEPGGGAFVTLCGWRFGDGHDLVRPQRPARAHG